MSNAVPKPIRKVWLPARYQAIHGFHKKQMGWDQQAQAPDVAPPPVIEDVEGTRQDAADALRRRRGRASAIVNDGSTPMTASKVLLGG